jgi:hypothetical protein
MTFGSTQEFRCPRELLTVNSVNLCDVRRYVAQDDSTFLHGSTHHE